MIPQHAEVWVEYPVRLNHRFPCKRHVFDITIDGPATDEAIIEQFQALHPRANHIEVIRRD